MRRVTVRVPATSANLGSGYDAFGLALGLYNQVSAELAEEWTVGVVGEGAGELPSGHDNRVARAMERVFEESGESGQAARILSTNRIPTGHGMGSSSAAIVAGMTLADALSQTPLGRNRIFELAVEMEGHPDNVAAALWGGFTLSWIDGDPRCAQLGPESGLAAILVQREKPLDTPASRGLLPRHVPHADAAFSAGRAALLAAAMACGRTDLIGAGLQDRLHQPYRAAAVPDLDAVRCSLLDAGAEGAALSGAGPSVIGLVSGFDDARALRRAKEVAAKAAVTIADLPGRMPPMVLAVDRIGAVIV